MTLLYERILVRGLFVLALLAVGGLPGVSAQTTLPPCTADLIGTDGYTDNDDMDVDKDNDGLIEICDLEGLNEMRFVLNGSGYKTTDSDTVTAITAGCRSGVCTGYELTRHLNFMDTSSYRPGSTNRTAWTTNLGWQPIGSDLSNAFTATFNGDGYTISNLMINRSSTDFVGLFGYAGSNSTLTAIGLINVDINGQSRVGSLAGHNVGVITNSYVSGEVEGAGERIGGLVGNNAANATITDSCATASVSGLGKFIGGLVGNNFQGTITNSCATGTVSGSGERVGGLVGFHQRGTITRSYATGSVSGDSSSVGGLVGNNDAGTITNSYATGSVSGAGSSIGGLVGVMFNDSTIMNSYATGSVSGSDTSSNVGGLVGQLNQGTDTISNSYWLEEAGSSLDSIGDGSSLSYSAERTIMELTSPTAPGASSTDAYHTWLSEVWDFGTSEQYPRLRNVGIDMLVNAPRCSLNLPDTDRDGVGQAIDIDKNNNGLIEICDVEGLNAIRNNLSGGGDAADGCPADGCIGFELTRSLDFMDDDSYRNAPFNKATYLVTNSTDMGWQPIGDASNRFSGRFNGRGHTISNLMINRSGTANIGLFGYTGDASEITNVGLLNLTITGQGNVGSLAGTNAGVITNSYATTGTVAGTGTTANVGGLVGNATLRRDSSSSSITNSCATVSISGPGANSNVGGLVGLNAGSEIQNSCATGSISGPGATSDVGGLVGHNSSGATIENSYATGAVSWTGSTSNVGGLVGLNSGSTIRNSYATGRVEGTDSRSDVGGLVGESRLGSTITNNYATGEVSGTDDDVGGLIGSFNTSGRITNSYWLRQRDSASSGGTNVPAATSRTMTELTAPTAPGATAADVYYQWLTTIWDFGTSEQFPMLRNVGVQEVEPPGALPLCTNDLIGTYTETIDDGVDQGMDVDKDGDGLIEICDLDGLNEMRFVLDGSGYRAAADAMIISTGCPSTSCTGFELTKSLDFMDDDSYREGSINSAWTTGQGWEPIGPNGGSSFKATFDGNGYTISNLMINRTGRRVSRIGLFGVAQPPPGGRLQTRIANLGLLNVNTTGTFYVGSLAGQTLGVLIINSYATGSVIGTDEFVGGLVGRNTGTIRNSYAAVSVSAPNGEVGGLVGLNEGGTIRNSYATGEVGGSGNNRGGLVGFNQTDPFATAMIENSYATGRVIAGSDSNIGGLVGNNINQGRIGTITRSYWLRGSSSSTGTSVPAGTLKTMTELQEPTTNEGIYANWLTADWDFGTSLQYPILKYAAGDLTGDLTGDLIPGQGVGLRSLQPLTDGAEFITTLGEATAFSEATTRHTIAVPPGTSEIGLTLTAYNSDDNSNTTIEVVKEGEDDDFFVGMRGRGTASVPITTTPVLIITVTEPNLEPIVYQVVVAALPPCTFDIDVDDDDDSVDRVIDIDKDGDGLIEICDLEGLDEMRHSLDGSGYKADATATTNTTGCPSVGGCIGYELANSLDFTDDDNYRNTDNKGTYTVSDYDDSNDNGWDPVGKPARFISGVRIPAAPFNAKFDGNGYTISNLMINRENANNIGLFGDISGSGIANLGLLDVDIRGNNFAGGLVGTSSSPIINSYVTGSVRGGLQVGGLVGTNGNFIGNSYATASVRGQSNVGGLVGVNNIFIENSYATGTVSGSGNNIGGLVGDNQSAGSITDSYTTGIVSGSRASSNVGGLVGMNNNDRGITDSYWLVGSASSGGSGVPANTSRTALQLASPTSATGIYTSWGSDGLGNSDDWDFGDDMQYPALKYGGDVGDDCADPEITPVKSVTGPPICGTVLANQEVDIQGVLPPCTMDIPDTDNDGVDQAMDVDKDGDGLIEICDLDGLFEIRYQLDGSGYTTGTSAMGAMKITTGCPNDRCTGYELTRDLDFMDDDSYRRPESTNRMRWTTNPTWDPIGDASNPRNYFQAEFNGNGYTISNLTINRTNADYIGLFGVTANNAEIANLGLLDMNIEGRSFTGGLAGLNLGAITNDYTTGEVIGSGIQVGGLIGNNLGTIMDSYATASITRSGDDAGGLAGLNSGTITNSYATGRVIAGSNNMRIGGLVGNNLGTITNSYATGSISGTMDIGGLVGTNGEADGNIGTIRNSYATGNVNSIRPTGGLIGSQVPNATIVHSYWSGSTTMAGTSEDDTNVPANTKRTAEELQLPIAPGTTSTEIYYNWSTDDWDFGSSIQYPILKASDSDTLLPSQGIGLRSLQTSTTGAELTSPFDGETTRHTITLPPGTSEIDLTLITYNSTATIELVKEGEPTNYFAGEGGRGSATVPITTNPVLIITVTEPDVEPIVYQVVVTALPSCTFGINVDDTDEVDQIIDIDKDGDGLIEICDLEGLDEMRHQLNGMGYNATDGGTAVTTGCPDSGCNGYELTKSLDFMDDNSYRTTANKVTWTVADYDDSSDTGWQSIGGPIIGDNPPFGTTFEGNGYTISNLMINRSGTGHIGLFGGIDGIRANAKIANLGLLDVTIIGQNGVGSVVGQNYDGSIINSYATGSVSGTDNVGGLAGFNSNGASITNSYAAVSVAGRRDGVALRIGGLIGQNDGTIENSYATGSVDGIDQIGGLVGWNDSRGRIMNSYATGLAEGSGADVGGLVGLNNNIITGSYWLSRPGLSNGTGDTTSTPTTAMALTSPTTPTTMIYTGWSTSDWDFGSSSQYPALRYAKGTDPDNPACSDTPPQTSSDQPQCETLLSDGQPVNASIRFRIKVFLEGPLQ